MNRNECPVYNWRKINRQASERERIEKSTQQKVQTLLNTKKYANTN